MKKILLAAVAALAITGCSQNEEIENAGQKAQINFGTVVSNSTKAAITDLTELQKAGAGFTMYAYNTGAALAGVGALSNVLIDNKPVEFKDGAWVVGTGTPIYWPGTDKVQFFTYAPKGDVSAIYSVPEGAFYPTIAYTVPTDATLQKDFVVASVLDQSISKSDVLLKFTHALTQINFTVKGKDANLTYIVKSISLVGIAKEGTYDYKSGWTLGNAVDEYPFPIAETTVNGQTEVDLSCASGSLMLLPQSMTDATKIEITYDVKNGDQVVYLAESSLIDLKTTTDWSAGKKIRYTLTLSNQVALKFSLNVDGWDKETEDEVEK